MYTYYQAGNRPTVKRTLNRYAEARGVYPDNAHEVLSDAIHAGIDLTGRHAGKYWRLRRAEGRCHWSFHRDRGLDPLLKPRPPYRILRMGAVGE